jgi:peptide/nickel transport system substrate-binding protein
VSPGAKGNTVKLTKEVRQAIGYALDYNGTVEFTVAGQGKLQPAPIPNGFPGTDNLPTPTQDIAKAKELLEKAGLGNGFEINAEFPNMNVYGVDLSLLMQKVQQDLAQVNIKVALTPLEFSVWRTHVRGDGIPLTAVFYAPDYFGSAQYIQYFAMTEGTPWWKRAGGANDASITNAKEGDLLKQALAAPEAEKSKFFHDIAMEMINDRVIIPLVSPNVVLAHAKSVKGVRYSATATCRSTRSRAVTGDLGSPHPVPTAMYRYIIRRLIAMPLLLLGIVVSFPHSFHERRSAHPSSASSRWTIR